MAVYTILWSFTDEGARLAKDLPEVRQRVSQSCVDNGGTLRDMFLCIGEYDALTIIDTPDDNALVHILTDITGWGFAHTQTLKCLPVSEYAAVIKKAA